jgi:signal transduction histidine kinase
VTSEPSASARPDRFLVLAPIGRDSEALVQTLSRAGIAAEPCSSTADLCARMAEGAGGAVVASEVLATRDRAVLERALEGQPDWSDFPLVIMETSRGGRRPSAALARVLSLSYAVVLVRPVHTQTLVSAVHAALRSRSRQYQVRDELADRRRAESALRESNERKDEFLAMLGHELRNPLAAIRNATELMKLVAPGDSRLQRAHGVLDRQSAHMTRLIDGLLEVSRIARGKIRLNRDTLEARDVVHGVLHDRRPQARALGLQLADDLPPEPVWIHADHVRVAQVLDNLLGNAIKFTDAGGSIRVLLDVDRGDPDRGSAVFRVRDTGIGIRPEALEGIFDPFQQETQELARSSGGLGLGLALAKGLVELHGGTIEAHSAGPGTGAEFEVRLPLAPRPAARGDRDEASAVASRRILVVEDNTDAGQSLRDLLELLGHRVEVVESGPEALEVLARRGADVVLCDLGLPGMSGYDVARAVRGTPALTGTRLVALTGYGQPEDRRRTNEAGFDDHLVKPVDVATLNEALREL